MFHAGDAEEQGPQRGKPSINQLSSIVIEEAIAIHRELGPGLFETVYETVLAGRLERRGLRAERQVPVPIEFDGHTFGAAF